jgi:hypothetical protein
MKTLIKDNLSAIQTKCEDILVTFVKGLRVSKPGNLQIFLSEQLSTEKQDKFVKAIETLDNDLTATYQENLNEFGEPIPYMDKKRNKQYLSPAFCIHKISEPKDIDDMFADLEA